MVNDILLYKASAKKKVRQDIAKRPAEPEERKRLYTLLKNDAWLSDNFLHRRMRKHYRHGVSRVCHQFVVRSDRHTEEIIDGRLVITIKMAKKYGGDIRLATTTNGKDVNLVGSNLRIIVKGDVTEIHYAHEKDAGRPHGGQALGLDKGYSEAFVDSDGQAYGKHFGRILTDYSDRVAATGQARNKLHALEKKHRADGRTAKADRILNHNLGRKKLLNRRDKTRKQLRNAAYQSAHAIVDKAALVVSEDLTAPIASKEPWRRFNRRMSSWAKGVCQPCTGKRRLHVANGLANGLAQRPARRR